MKVTAALLLTVLCLSLTTRTSAAWRTLVTTSNSLNVKDITTTVTTEDEDAKLPEYATPLVNPKKILLQEIHTLDKDIDDRREKTQEKNQQMKDPTKMPRVGTTTLTTITTTTTALPKIDNKTNVNVTKDRALKKLLEAEDMGLDGRYNGLNADNADDKDDVDDDDEDENTENEYTDEDEYLEEDGDFDDEYVMTQCPDYCRCIGQYAAATTARCSKFVDQQFLGPDITNLQIINAGEIRLGPYSLKSHGLLQMKSVDIMDTRIVDLDRTAFDGIPYLFAVNLTRNALQDIHPLTFQNNSHLSLLSISGNPLKHGQYLKGAKHILFDAPTVTELVFSNNGITKLPRTAFQKMQSLTYINLSGNSLKEIEKTLFDPLDALVELDLSDNQLNEIPTELFDNSDLETLVVSGNGLSTLAFIRASRLTTLEAARNRIKIIAKDDLSGVPSLDRLDVSSNGMKKIHQHAFANLEQLTHLDVSNNRLTSWTEHHLRANPRLQVLLMNGNADLGDLPVFKTTGLEYDTFSVYRFECANCGLDDLSPQTFDSMPALTILNLSKNRLSGLPNGLLKSLSSLRSLDLSENLIHSLDENMFRGASSLTKLSIAGNPLVTLQVSPFLLTPELYKLDVSGCELERVWSEARVPLKSLRVLLVRGNMLRRITQEELKAMPKLSGLDILHNPLECDEDFNLAIQWLTDHGVTPIEKHTHSSYGENMDYSDFEGITRWADVAKIVCSDIAGGPPSRTISKKILFPKLFDESKKSSLLETLEDNDDYLTSLDQFTQTNEDTERAWDQNEYKEYGDFAENTERGPTPYHMLWPVLMVIMVTLVILLLVAHVAVSIGKCRGRSPVIRPPMILRQGLVDNKNCGLVYKPLQEEIATPHMPKRGSFYSSSTFHYDKIVPESV